MPRFTKRPVTIDAILAGEVLDGATSGRFAPSTLKDDETLMPQWIIDAFNQMVLGFESSMGNEAVLINTQGHGQVRAERTDWIIRGVNGELYPCRPDVFEKTYDPSEGPLGVLTLKGDISEDQILKLKETITNGSIARLPLIDSMPESNLSDQLDLAWGLIANVGGGAWSTQTLEWQAAAARWRDHYINDATEVEVITEPLSNPGITDFKITHVAVTERGFELGGTTNLGSRRVEDLPAESFRAGYEVDDIKKAIVDQPPPKPTEHHATWELVIADFRKLVMKSPPSSVTQDVLDDMAARDKTGRERYGVPLTAYNGRDQLIDAYQEMLDAAVYLRAAMEEGLPVDRLYDMTLVSIVELRAFINARKASQ